MERVRLGKQPSELPCLSLIRLAATKLLLEAASGFFLRYFCCLLVCLDFEPFLPFSGFGHFT